LHVKTRAIATRICETARSGTIPAGSPHKAAYRPRKKEVHMKRLMLALLASGALLWGMDAVAATAAQAQQAINSAKAAMAKTEAIHYQWLATPKLLEAAEAAYKAGKYDEAVAKAEHAQKLAELAYEQGESQAKKYGVRLTKEGVSLE
jgi:hypothetical protein